MIMENINIIINKKTRQVYLSKNVIGNDGENLQEKLVFSFNDEFVDGTARLELIKNKTKSYIMLTKVDNTYMLPVRYVITKVGKLDMQLVITEGTNNEEIPIFKSNSFYMIVNSSINAEIEEPDEYSQWIDVANTKLNEIDSAITETNNLDLDVSKVGKTSTVTLTSKLGLTKEVEIEDGLQGQPGQNGITPTIGDNGNWYLGETDTGKPSRGIQGETGATGSAGQDGISPTVTTSKNGNTTTITITDKTGEHTATIIDGTNGTNGRDGYVQYTAGENITIENNVISAIGGSGSNAEFNIINYAGQNNNNNEFIVTNIDKGFYLFLDDYNSTTNTYGGIYYKWNATDTSRTRITLDFSARMFMIVLKPVSEMTESGTWAYVVCARRYQFENTEGQFMIYRLIANISNHTLSTFNVTNDYPVSLLTPNNQLFKGTKFFQNLPQLSSYIAPTDNRQFAPKKYVDDCLSNTGITADNFVYANSTNPVVLSEIIGKGWLFRKDIVQKIYLKKTANDSNFSIFNTNGALAFCIFKDYTTVVDEEIIGYTYLIDPTNNELKLSDITYNITYDQFYCATGYPTGKNFLTSTSQTFYGAKTFDSIPSCSTTPTSNNHLVNKSYVDDSIASAITTALNNNY